jgi:transitional endoplasmic reticulum ATPase
MVEAKAPKDDRETKKESKTPISEEVIKRHYKRMPIGLYHIREELMDTLTAGSFPDALLVVVALIAVVSFLNFYPIEWIIVIVIALFLITLYKPFLGLIFFTVAVFPIYMYQTPMLAWTFVVAAAVMLIYGYMHYRLAVFTYALFAMAFSPLGYLFEIPLLIFCVLTLGAKRSMVALVIAVAFIIMFSAVTGLQNTGYVLYSAQQAHMAIVNSSPIGSTVALYDAPTKPGFNIFNFGAGIGATISSFTNFTITGQVPSTPQVFVLSFMVSPGTYIAQVVLFIVMIAAMDIFASNTRSKFKGMRTSLIGVIYPVSFLLFTNLGSVNILAILLPFASFILAPIALYMLEYYEVNVVKILDVKKQDIRMKFGEAFEDLEAGTTNETFDDIGNYESTKKELKEAIISPIEEKGVSHAYNIKPSKGILFFGPPGTGKTMMMRALANEIHAGFFQVKATNLISAFPGESERLISNIFTIARKNAPCVLFFDEIDSIAVSRENPSVDDTHRHALSQLLVEMDGFTKVKNVIIVGATNRPDLLDKAMMRPGRFDRIVYMPLPDANGRKKIFQIYLSKLPIGEDIDLKQLTEKTERYSGADIKALCESVAQLSAQEAASEHKILQITQQDIMNVIKSSKPSTSLAQMEDYRKFKLDFERTNFKGTNVEERPTTSMDEIKGLDQVKKSVRESIEVPLLHPDLVKKYDIKVINGLLLFGPPGNGKTMLMRAISGQMKGVTILEMSAPELAEQGIDRATATIREIFNRAKENAPSIIMIDEIDGLLPKRDSASEIGVQITSEVLKQIDGIKQTTNVVLVGATNRPEALDPAILRPGRFDKLVFVKPPSAMARADIFKEYLANTPCATLDYQKLGNMTRGYTGADIAGICREAKTASLQSELSTGAEGKVTMDIIEGLIKSTKPSAPDSVVAEYAKFLAQYGQR